MKGRSVGRSDRRRVSLRGLDEVRLELVQQTTIDRTIDPIVEPQQQQGREGRVSGS